MMKILVLIFALLVICNASLRDDILEKTQQLAQIRQYIAQSRKAFEYYHEVAINQHDFIQSALFSEEKKSEITRASPQCLSSVASFFLLFTNGSCQGYFATYFNSSSSSTAKQNAVSGFCSNCATQFVSGIQSIIQNCNRTDYSFPNLKAAGFYAQFLCSKDNNGNLCANVLQNVASNIPQDFTQVTKSQLDNICSPCVLIALSILQQSNNVIPNFYSSFIILKAICVKFNGVYCILALAQVEKTAVQIAQQFATNQTVSANSFEPLLEAFCSPCFRLLTIRLTLANDNSAISVLASFSAINFLCRKNAAKQYCFIKLYNVVQNVIISGVNPCSSSNQNYQNLTCSNDCANLIKSVVNQGGCCWALLADQLSLSGPGDSSSFKQQIYSFIGGCVPGLSLPAPCVSVGNASITITYTNLYALDINNLRSAFILAVLADLNIAVAYDSVDQTTITVTSNKRGSTVVSIPYVSTTATSGATLYNPVVECISVCNAITSNDPSQLVTVSSTSSNVVIQSSSSIISFSAVLLFLLSFFFF